MNEVKKTLNECLKEFQQRHHWLFLKSKNLNSPISIQQYKTWLDKGYHASMDYLKDHVSQKENPHSIEPNLKSVITVSYRYFPLEKPLKSENPARVALYAQNEDYHFWVKEKLADLIQFLKSYFPEDQFLSFVDSGPVLERDWAAQTGMGWVGKNTCLINPKEGSLFFLAEIMTSVDVQNPQIDIIPDFCGNCTRCIDICPTQALVEPRVLDANKCISYLTIENKSAPPLELRKKMGDWFFGCDLCQTVCPWNEKFFRHLLKENVHVPAHSISTQALLELDQNQRNEMVSYFQFLLTSSHKTIEKTLHGTALKRAGPKQLKRNALIVIANQNLTELKTTVENLNWPEEKELIQWTLNELNPSAIQ